MSTSTQGVQPAEYGRQLDETCEKINEKENEIKKIANQIDIDIDALRIRLRKKAEADLTDDEELAKEKFRALEELKQDKNKLLDLLNTSEVYLLLFYL